MKKPQLIIIGGANGSGKTTVAQEFVALEDYVYLGVDEIPKKLLSTPQEFLLKDLASC